MLFSLNATIVVFVVSFLIFMWLLNHLMLKPVGNAIEKRAQLTEDNIEAGKSARNQAQQLLANYEDELKQIRHQAQAEIAKATEEANHDWTVQLDRVAKDGQAKLDKARQDITAEREQLIDALVPQEKELVETITRKVLGDESVQVDLDNVQVRRTLEETCQ